MNFMLDSAHPAITGGAYTVDRLGLLEPDCENLLRLRSHPEL